eukprot:TRINITY_DN411_c1_g1_i2.p1 TRINITY_DN411_c1_g1~~TRINITY_DN411_c1_g1_i2.p1  ORF type:complete len:150 (+),score=33.08 TRINITY_DN411_c1_g1_i2:68-517(+)
MKKGKAKKKENKEMKKISSYFKRIRKGNEEFTEEEEEEEETSTWFPENGEMFVNGKKVEEKEKKRKNNNKKKKKKKENDSNVEYDENGRVKVFELPDYLFMRGKEKNQKHLELLDPEPEDIQHHSDEENEDIEILEIDTKTVIEKIKSI